MICDLTSESAPKLPPPPPAPLTQAATGVVKTALQTEYFVLQNRVPVRCANYAIWSLWMTRMEWIIKLSEVEGVRVSTVFLGRGNAAELFETIACTGPVTATGGPVARYRERCASWAEAEKQHDRICERIRPGGMPK